MRAAPQTVSAWVRDVLLNAVHPDPVHFLLLAEVLALRTITVNLQYALVTEGPPDTAAMRRLIDRADAERFTRAQERLDQLRQATDAARQPPGDAP